MHDSHIHLAMKPLNENWERDTQDFLNLGGRKIVTQGTDILDFCETFELAQKINDRFEQEIVRSAIGIHPTVFQEKFNKKNVDEIFESSKKFLNRFQDIFEKEKVRICAIGETGLDYFQMKNFNLSQEVISALKEIQKESFRLHVRLAKENDLPLSIHAREIEGGINCVTDALEILAQEGKGLVKGVFHSYTGELSKLSDILDMGFYVGFNAIITYPNGKDVREILKNTPLDRILFETDGPFLPTESIRKNKKATIRYGRSAQVREIMKIASDIKKTPLEKLESATDENFNMVFG
ncbi:MAG: TatD family hydrolase [Candidatus Dojkabacteria bacterium]|jgi:TatD DNase family protein|nr:TatD family hydrolase [Candidatus Dojkabacteria bacterium]MDD2270016.1 TatD family hydrolase [Candidatus Dojkabacteria bacterium]